MKKKEPEQTEQNKPEDTFKRCIDCFWCVTGLIDSDEAERGPDQYICCYSPTDGIPWIPCYSVDHIEREIKDALSRLGGVRRELIKDRKSTRLNSSH